MQIIKEPQIIFKLNDGSTMLIEGKDYDNIMRKLKDDLVAKMMLEQPQNVYFEKDLNEYKIGMLYKVLQENKSMNEELKNNYLKAILEFTKGNSKIIEPLKELMKK